jgi:hypothetical protein
LNLDVGKSFKEAIKLGNGSWKLNGCPMDGGGLVIDKNGNPQTVWRREEKSMPLRPEKPKRKLVRARVLIDDDK